MGCGVVIGWGYLIYFDRNKGKLCTDVRGVMSMILPYYSTFNHLKNRAFLNSGKFNINLIGPAIIKNQCHFGQSNTLNNTLLSFVSYKPSI